MTQATLPRTAKGKRPDYFSDPAIDKLLAIVLALAGELSVTRERLDTLERLLDASDLLDRSKLDEYQPCAKAEAERDAAREAYLQRVLRIVQAQRDETTGTKSPIREEDILRHLS